MSGGNYGLSQRNKLKQNEIKNQRSQGTTETIGERSENYKDVSFPKVPSDSDAGNALLKLISDWWQTAVIFIAIGSGVAAFITFSDDLAKASSDVSENKRYIEKNRDKVHVIDKLIAIQDEKVANTERRVGELKHDLSVAKKKLDKLSEKQIALEVKVGSNQDRKTQKNKE